MLRPFALSPDSPIRVFLVDDSPLALVLLQRMLATSPLIEVVGTARGGREALEQFQSTRPEVICTDYLMPGMDGLALIQRTMEVFARPILVISSTIDPAQRQKAFPLLAAGAVDVVAKPSGRDSFEQSAAELVQKIKLVSGVAVISRPDPGSSSAIPDGHTTSRDVLKSRLRLPVSQTCAAPDALGESNRVKTATNGALANGSLFLPNRTHPIRIVAVGASTGGPQVLQSIFASLPSNFPCPVVCVQHISPGFLAGLVDWLDGSCRVRVKIADNGEQAQPGTVYFAQEQTHLEVSRHGRLIYSHAPPVDGHKPSVTATFESLARSCGHGALGILLSGMGDDGAAGLESIARAGGTTIAQDEASCVVFGMPKQAILRGAAQFVLPPAEIARALLRLCPAL